MRVTAVSVELRTASDHDVASARRRWEDRHRAWWARDGLAPEDIDARLARIDEEFTTSIDRFVHVIGFGNDVVGSVSSSTFDRGDSVHGRIEDIWIAPEHRGRRLGVTARTEIERWLRTEQDAAVALVNIDPSDPAQLALFGEYRLQAQRMMIAVEKPPVLPDDVSYRPFPESEFEAWQAAEIEGYAKSIADSGALTMQAAHARSVSQFAEMLPNGLATPGHAFWMLESQASKVAMIWLRHQNEHRRSFVYMVEVYPEHRGKGYGKTVMRLGELMTYEAGDNVLALNVFGQNETAIGLYTKLGYSVMDQSRMLDLPS